VAGTAAIDPLARAARTGRFVVGTATGAGTTTLGGGNLATTSGRHARDASEPALAPLKTRSARAPSLFQPSTLTQVSDHLLPLTRQRQLRAAPEDYRTRRAMASAAVPSASAQLRVTLPGRGDIGAAHPNERPATIRAIAEVLETSEADGADAPEEHDLVPGVVTDDDVIRFYARHGAHGEVSSRHKFFYCVPAEPPGSIDHRPYDLVVVRRGEVGAGRPAGHGFYFTISVTGVTKITPGVSSEFTSVGDWVREKTSFRVWRRTPFFARNREMQFFRQWRLTVRRRNYLRKRELLQRRLFLAQPTFVAPLVAIRGVLDDLRRMDLARLRSPDDPALLAARKGADDSGGNLGSGGNGGGGSKDDGSGGSKNDGGARPRTAAVDGGNDDTDGAAGNASGEGSGGGATAPTSRNYPALDTSHKLNSSLTNATGAHLEDYVRQQASLRDDELQEAVNQQITRLQTILEATCRGAQRQARLYQESVRDHRELDDRVGVDLYHKEGDRHKSMVVIKAEKTRRAETYRRVMEEAGRLGTLVRLADYMACTALADQAVHTAEHLSHVLNNTRKDGYVPEGVEGASFSRNGLGKKLFVTYASFGPAGRMDFEPAVGDFSRGLLGVVDGVAAMISSNVLRLLRLRVFGQFFRTRLQGLHLGHMIRGSPRFVAARAAIVGAVEEDFAEAQAFVDEFESLRPVVAFYGRWDSSTYDLEAATPTSLGDDFIRMRGDQSKLMKVLRTQCVGIINIDVKVKIRSVVLPQVTNAQTDLRMLMVRKLEMVLHRAGSAFDDRLKLLESRPDKSDLQGFHAYKAAIETELRPRQEEFQAEFQVAQDLVDMMGQSPFDVRLEARHQAGFLELSRAVERFHLGLGNADEWIRAQRHSYLARVERKIGKSKDAIQELSVTLASLSATTVEDRAQVLRTVADLEEKRARVRALRDEAASMLRYKRSFALGGAEDNRALVRQETAPDEDGADGEPASVSPADALKDRLADEFEAGDEAAVTEGLSRLGLSSLQLVEKELQARHDTWSSFAAFLELKHRCEQDALSSLDVEALEPQVSELGIRAAQLLRANRSDTAAMQLRNEVADFAPTVPLLLVVANRALESRHWREIFTLLGHGDDWDPRSSTEVNLVQLLEAGVQQILPEVEAVSAAASKEFSLKQALARMRKEWEGVNFTIVPYGTQDMYLLGGVDEIQLTLDDQLVKTQSMLVSPFIVPIQAEADGWADQLDTLQSIIDNQLQCQQAWQYLEPIFASADIRAQMPTETSKFQIVDATYRKIMRSMVTRPECLRASRDKDRLKELKDSNGMLEEIERGLAAYLEVKRVAFPRFFFLSNDAMLEILSQTKDPSTVQPHLGKCFEGISKLRFEGAHKEIHAMQSVEGEEVPFSTPVRPRDAKGAVEKWLVQVESSMVEAVREACERGVADYEKRPRPDWVLRHPGQVVLVASNIYWTREIEGALRGAGAGPDTKRDDGLEVRAEACTSQLNDIVELVRGELSHLQRATLSALVVMDVHQRDVTADLVREVADAPPSVSDDDPLPFAWTSQLRTYWETRSVDKKGVAVVRMMNASIEYGCEYLGNSSRLVVTPLTDRCYRTLMGAIHLNLGGAPEGPAGTGKTETTKDLAKALARQCVVFNCSDDLGCAAMAKFFKGLATSGAWACFDEFNRINLEVLSVVAQQVLDIQTAVRAGVETFWFEGSELRIVPTCNVFITMNPGYAGRSELPDNLKALFRTVAMMVPDYAMIAEIKLYSYGYLKARDCARKIVATYRLCSEQLSSQRHYDYGMRAVMAVLQAAGNLKRRFPDDDEFILMLRSIVDVNLCKFLAHDVPLFHGIVSDLFPGVVLPEPDYAALEAALRGRCRAHNLQAVPYFMNKAIQLYEMVVVRHGLMVVGGPFSGKTSVRVVLQEALTELGEAGVPGALFEPVRSVAVSPKAVYKGDLYGENDKATQEWKDGVLGVAFRRMADRTDETPGLRWTVMDGPVDAVWIENMNTVLDDNKKLCLPNSEIVPMHPKQSMIFETGDLNAASPATVSRCGMVYLEPHQLGWDPMLTSWLATLPATLGSAGIARVAALLRWLLPALLRWVAKDCRELSPTSPINVAQSAMRLTSALLKPEFGEGDQTGVAAVLDENPAEARGPSAVEGEGKGDNAANGETSASSPAAKFDDAGIKRRVDGAVLLAIVWSAGCTGDGESRTRFDALLRRLLAGGEPASAAPFGDYAGPPVTDLAVPVFPDADAEGHPRSVHEWALAAPDAPAGSPSWRLWTTLVPPLKIPAAAKFSDIIVPTADLARVGFLLDLALDARYPLLLCGPSGTGKSVYAGRHLTRGLPRDKWVQIFLTFSARTTAAAAQEQIDGRLDKRRKGHYGPPLGTRAVVLVDDLNMPAQEEWGAQPPIELLRQFEDQRGWYARDGKTWLFRHLEDVSLVGAMGPPGGGRTYVTDRFLRHFHLVTLADPDSATLSHIFGSILGWHLGRTGQEGGTFPPDVSSLSGGVIDFVLSIYQGAVKQLLPTPAKSHYLFNLRDFARVIQGVMLLPAKSLAGPDASRPSAPAVGFQRLVVHETLRVFYDRLVDDNDRRWLLGEIRTGLENHLGGATLEGLFPHLLDPARCARWGPALEPGAEDIAKVPPPPPVIRGEDGKPLKEVGLEHLRRLFFVDFCESEVEPDARSYSEVQDVPAILRAVEGYLAYHDQTSKRPLNLAIFLFACEHVARICRLLRQPGGHALLVGVGGSGRQSLTRLAASILGMPCRQVEISKNYRYTDWLDDLKGALLSAGQHNKHTVFLFSDAQIKDEGYVEDLNNILNSGEVPGLFPTDERLTIMEEIRPRATKLGLETPLEVWGHFTETCRQRLHVVLALSPIGDAFRTRLRQNPSLINCCTINWFQAWPEDALVAVARKGLAEMTLTDPERVAITDVCQRFHASARLASERFLAHEGRHNYVTPTSYLELLSLFATLLDKGRKDNEQRQDRYRTGLKKLGAAAGDVAALQEALRAKQPVLRETVADVERMLADVAREKTEVVEPQAAAVGVEEDAARAVAREAKALKDECDGELAVAMPALEEALAALQTIKDADIQYIKKLPNPPQIIKTVMHAVCLFLGEKPARGKDESGRPVEDWWKTAIATMGRKSFIDDLRGYDKDNIRPALIAQIRADFTSDENFNAAAAKRASAAAAGLCKWVHAMDKYEDVAKRVAPLRASADAAGAKYEGVMTSLRAKQAELKVLTDRLADMERELQAAQGRKADLEREVELTATKLERAEKLIGGLGGEQVRWTAAAEQLAADHRNLVGDMLLSAGAIGYLGAFTSSYRADVGAEWQALLKERNLPCSDVLSMQAVLGKPIRIREWLLQGLPNDSFSIDNAIMVDHARRWPLMIDPQGQANKWVKNAYRAANLQTLKLTDGASFLRTLESAIQFGLPVLLENIEEELDPSLEPLLLRQTFRQGGVDYLRLGDTQVEYSHDFRFFITTKLRNPHYLPEVAVKVTLLNFVITPDGLSDQMLNVVVGRERPDLEARRDELVRQGAANRRRLAEIEDEILRVLSESEGNILDDETAIRTISTAKALGKDIEERETIARATEAEIEDARRAYAPCGDFASLLFFAITALGEIDPMYQYSLPWFVALFVSSVERAVRPDDSEDVPSRLAAIRDHFTYALFCNVCRSLFGRDKILFAFLLASRIDEAAGSVNVDEWMFLLTGGLATSGDQALPPNPAPAWLSDRAWRELGRLGAVGPKGGPLEGVDSLVASDVDAWRALYDADDPLCHALPGNLQLSPFHRILLMRCVRLDKVVASVTRYVEASLGARFVAPPPFDLKDCFADSSNVTPLIFVLSAGSDPTALLQQFADEAGMGQRLQTISLGDGQGPKAETLIAEAAVAGDWVALFNCHLAPSWMPTLDRICDALGRDALTGKVDPSFRLWLTSYPSPRFPVDVLQSGVKMVVEPPRGLRANLLRTLTLDPICDEDGFYEGCSNAPAFKKLLFGLAFLHAVVQERRSFGPLGWNVPYGFDDGDLRISARQLRLFIDEAPGDSVPFDALRYVTGECNYGGRVTDDKDRLLLNTLLRLVYAPATVDDDLAPLSASGVYHVPAPGSLADLRAHVEAMPSSAAPEAFGLHANADLSKDQQASQALFTSLLSLSSGGSSGGAEASGEADARVAALLRECLDRLPEPFDLEDCARRYPLRRDESMNTVLMQEMERFNGLAAVVRTTLQDIDLALKGLQVMSSSLEACFQSLALGMVPALWKAVSYPSLKPLGSYLDDLYARLGMLSRWRDEGPPSVHWISGFFFVQSFLTASLQNYARKEGVPIDEVGFDHVALGLDPAAYPEAPVNGIYCRGLFLEGCGWDANRGVLRESLPKVLAEPAPVLHFVPAKTADFRSFRHYACPVYRTTERRGILATTGHSTNFITFVRMPSDDSAERWTMAGVALVQSLSD